MFETHLTNLQTKATSLGVPVTIGYAGINAWLQIPTNTVITDYLDPFPTRYYHADGQRIDPLQPGLRYDNVKAYSGDSGLIQEIGFANSKIAGHIPFEFSLRPWSDEIHGQQMIVVHPWVPYSFQKDAVVSNNWTAGPYGNEFFGIYVSAAGDVNNDGYADVIVGGGH